MDKESTYRLQRIDCNCNNCGFLFRLFDKQNNVLAANKILSEEIFNLSKERRIKILKEDIEALEDNYELIKDAGRKISKIKNKLSLKEKEVFSFKGDTSPIQYGICCKFQKEITFLPNTIQLETQHCFIHRKDYTP